MKQVSNNYKNNIKKFGKQLDSIVTYTQNNSTVTLDNTQLNAITCRYNGAILKSIMKELIIDSNVEIPLNTILNYQFGVFTGEQYEYIDYGNYIVYKVEKKEDTNSYEITCYDKMLYSMVKYEALSITYPITIRNYLSAICTKLGLTFANSGSTFANYNREIPNELYLNSDNQDIGYTFRDVLDEIAQATGSTICINNNDQLELRYVYTGPTTSNNLLNVENYELGYYNSNRQFVENTKNALFTQRIEVTQNTYYCLSANTSVGALGFCWFDENDTYLDTYAVGSVQKVVRQPIANAKYLRIRFVKDFQEDITQELIDECQLMLEVGQDRTSYQPYIDIHTIDEHSLKNVNVNFGTKYGPINSIVLARASDSDSVYLQDDESIALNGLCELKISENQIMNGNDRSDYLPDLLQQLDGLEYYLNDYTSPGITYLELCDRYNVQIGSNTYSCVMFNDEINVTQGLEEIVHTELLEQSETDYTKADKTDRKINQTTLIVDKHEQEIQALINKVVDISNIVDGVGTVTLENAHEGILHKIEMIGSISLLFPSTQTHYGRSLMISDDLIVNNDTYISSGVPYQNSATYPSATQYPKGSNIIVDEDTYNLDFDYLNYLSPSAHDKYVYEDGRQWIERNVGIDAQGNMYALDKTIIENKSDIYINVKANSTITLETFGNGVLQVEYLLENKYTENFATQVYVDSSIKQTADEIELQVREKVNEDEIIAKINLAVENDQGIINLTGNTVTIDSDNFHLDEEGNIECQDAIIDDAIINNTTITGGTLTMTGDEQQPKITIIDRHFDGNGLEISASGVRYFDELGNKNTESYVELSKNGMFITENGGSLVDIAKTQMGGGYLSGSMTLWSIGGSGTTTLTHESVSSTEMYADRFINTSQEKKKNNISKVEKGLNILKDIDIYSYNYNSEKKSAKKHYGVVIGNNYKYSKEITNDTNEGVNLYSFISICCASIKEQQEQIEELQKEIKSLKEEKDGKDKLSK